MGLRGRVPPPRSGLRRLYPAHPAISKTSEDARWTQPGTPVDCGPTNGLLKSDFDPSLLLKRSLVLLNVRNIPS
jgi:hypothetical protein